MTREEMERLMAEAGVDGHSKLNMRSEVNQKKSSASKIPKLKKALKKKSKLLLVAELAVPFNPKTGEVDDEFNPINKYRPPFSATSVALLLKSMANENAATKEAFMSRAGISEWDTSDAENLTDADKKVFKKYRVPRIFSVSVCNVKIPKMTGTNYPKKYAVSVERDSSGKVVGEMPGFLKVNKLLWDIYFERCADLKRKIDSGEEVLTEQQQKEVYSRFKDDIVVSDDNPDNWIQLIELPLTAKYMLNAEALNLDTIDESVGDLVRICPYSKKIREYMADYLDGSLEVYDKYFDFYELDMKCPTDGDDTTQQGKMQIGTDTTYIRATQELEIVNKSKAIQEAVRGYIDNHPDVEEMVRRSIFVSDYNSEVEDQIYTSLKTVLDVVDNPFVTEAVIKANKEVIMLAYGEEGAVLVEDVDAGVSEKKSGLLSEDGAERARKEAKEEAAYDLGSDEFADDATSSLTLEKFSAAVVA